MSDPTTQSAPQPPAAAAPAGAEPAAAASAAPAAGSEAALVKPEFLPAQYWDDKAGIKTDEFAKHYGETVASATKWAERAAGVPEKPEGYKPELKLPDTVKVPEGVKFDPAKDPRSPLLLKLAHERGWTNDDVNALIAFDAQAQIAEMDARGARILAEDKKLGDKAVERRAAVTNWLKAQAEKGDLSKDEIAMVNAETADAPVITLIEKLMAKATGSIPGHNPTPPSRTEPKTHAERIWPGGFSSVPQAARAS